MRAAVGRGLPAWRTVRRWSVRLVGVAALCLAVGLPAVADLARAGTVAAGGYPTGYVAVGYTSLGLAVLLPVCYWVVAASLAAATLVGRRVVAFGRAVTGVLGRRLFGAGHGRGRPERGRDGRRRNRPPGVR